MKKLNHLLWNKFNGFSRHFLAYGFSGIRPFYIVNEYPKSGGTWLSQMLAAALDIPFPRNRLPILKTCILHDHFLWPGSLRNVVVLWRDGRDVIVSQYYYSLFYNEWRNRNLVDRVKNDLKFFDVREIRKNLPVFIEYVFQKNIHPRFSWADFVNRWQGKAKAVHVKYEDLRQNCAEELQRVVFELTKRMLSDARSKQITELFSFQKQSGRKPGQENTGSFLRKGIIGDWENHFSFESKKLFDRYAGNALISLGYEKDHSWVLS